MSLKVPGNESLFFKRKPEDDEEKPIFKEKQPQESQVLF